MKHFKVDKETASDQIRNAQPLANERVRKQEALQSWLVSRLAERLSLEPAEIDIHESFSNYGLDSATAVELSGELEALLERELSPTLFFDYPNIGVLLRHLLQDKKNAAPDFHQQETASGDRFREPIAIIGMGCRFPGNANTPEQFWHLLQNGVDAVTEVPSTRWNSHTFYDPDPEMPGKMYTRAGAFLQDLDQFDAHFFGISPREAVRMHPQQRLLLEVAWEALENAGQKLESLAESRTAVYVGVMATHDYALLQTQSGDATYIDDPYFGIGNASSITSGRLSYLFNLQGPNLAVDTACSSSLVAVHLASESLRNHECSMALAGGVSTNLHPEQMINACKMHMLSPDGLCKTFDADANGFVMGEGCGVVVLKRLSDALSAKDPILAVIRGSAVNQDGQSNGITAPNKFAQEAVIRQALAQARVDPLAVSYVEAHGSATSLGDPIEIEALAATFGQARSLAHPLMVGSVKTNIGHLAGAAGIAGLIKTVLALQHKEIPPHLHLKTRNPHVHWDVCPVVIPTVRLSWSADDEKPRLAGVSSFGWSGTNAHVILEEGPQIVLDEPETSKSQLILLSAKTEEALEHATAALLEYLKQHPRVSLADVAYTYHVGRTAFAHRRTLVCGNNQEAILALEQRDSTKIASGFAKESPRSLTFLFPDAGKQYAGMARQLYQLEPTFRAYINTCAELARTISGLNLLTHLYPEYWLAYTGDQHVLDQLAVFVIEYALTHLLLSWDITPTGLLGYGPGEYVSACLSGIFSLGDALQMIILRARAIQGPAHEEMLVAPLVHESMVSALPALHAAAPQTRSEEFMALMRSIDLSPAQMPCISNATGTWITPEQATDPAYWSDRLSQTAASVEDIGEIQQEQLGILIQVGPGQIGESFASSSMEQQARIIPTLPLAHDLQPDRAFLLHSMGQLWRAGVQIEGTKWYAYEKLHLLPLPNYPFIRQRYWIETPAVERSPQKPGITELTKQDRSQWLYVPLWKQAQPPLTVPTGEDTQCILIFLDDYGFGWRLGGQLRAQGHTVFMVTAGQSFQYMPEEKYTIRPNAGEDYDALLRHLNMQGQAPDQVIHLWSVTRGELDTQEQQQLARFYDNVFYSLLYLAQAIGNHLYASSLHLTIISNQLHNVLGDEEICPEKALLLGPGKVLPKEYPALSCCSIDITLADPGSPQESTLLKKLAVDIFRSTDKDVIAYRGTQRWEQEFENVRLPEHINGNQAPLRKGGVYLITGGLGGIGLAIAEHLARTVQARLVLVGRTPLPARKQWSRTIAARSTTATLAR
ncbi:MAG TPA: beta-ketoacyl synthase N-terminal-like domain-containing protein, partial [Ktedonobacteraceae bacterium]|nr:beta-ketoacyl synthase N-terminal-like domain-containing protein [Ktedonobacteraceae bacterium]